MVQESEFTLYEDFLDVYNIDQEFYDLYDVKRGLRNADGTGVLTGLTKISNVHGYIISENEKIPREGSLTYRGYEISDLVNEAVTHDHPGFRQVAYLLLTGRYPSKENSEKFQEIIEMNRELPIGFINNIISDTPPRNIMNQLIRSVVALYAYDEDAELSSGPESFRHEIHTAVSLIAKLPRIAVLGHYAKEAFYNNGSMIVHPTIPGESTAETILSMLRPDRQFTHDEAMLLDIMLMLHAEHGGGNNSTFTCRCLTSSGTDAYSAYAGAIASLKGPRHGGANIRALEQQEDLMASVKDWTDEGQIADYLKRTLAKEAYDGAGLVYGMGHAVYTLSDPRAVLCKKYAERLAQGTEYEPQFKLVETIERLTPEVIGQSKGRQKQICANIDMYSGLVYSMLGIPKDLFTPLFACARIVGWSAHRFEEIVSAKRIMRPAYKSLEVDKTITEVGAF